MESMNAAAVEEDATQTVTLAVVGSRTFRDYRLLCNALDDWLAERDTDIVKFVSGGAQGADQLGERWARSHDLECLVLKPNWRPGGVYNPRAGLERNTDIVARADVVVAFWDGVSTGTRDTIRKARQKGCEVRVVNFSQ
jgi:hypothetical protein